MISTGIFDAVLNLMYPRKCVFCRALLSKEEDGACPSCINGAKRVDNSKGQRHPEFCDGGVSAFYYEGNVKRAVHAFKFGRRPQYAGVFGALLGDAIEKDLGHDFDIVTWVPVSNRRRRKRGYDQAKLLCAETARRLGGGRRPVSCLQRTRDTAPQTGLKTAGRRANVLGAFKLKDGAEVLGKSVLLVDDVLTTGATLSECAGVLQYGGAGQVLYATFARTGKQK